MSGLVSRMRGEFSRFLKKRSRRSAEDAFMTACRRRWSQEAPRNSDSVVLVGLFAPPAAIFCNAFVVNDLARRLDSRVECYQLMGGVSSRLQEIYESFGAKLGLTIEAAAIDENIVQAKAAELMAGVSRKEDVFRMAIEGLPIGDQVYDSYLRYYCEPTVKLDDPRFADLVVQAVRIYYACQDYLSRRRVTAFISDDSSYINAGIITRLMFRAKVPVYNVILGTPFWILRVDPEPPGTEHGFPPPFPFPYYNYPQLFAQLAPETQAAALQKGRETIENRLRGKFDPLVRMASSTFEAGTRRVLDDGPEPRILVLLHDFVDSPHGYRNMLFPDFLEWIRFLLDRAGETPFRWYVKPHPSGLDPSRKALNAANEAIVESLRQSYPNVTFLPPTASNQQILADGISAMFNVHGTAGHEFAYRGVPVVNGGDNPHIGYKFNIHATSREQYAECIRNAGSLKIEIDPREIEEFVYMHYFYLEDHLGSPVNLMDESILDQPEGFARLQKPESLPELMSGVTAERERGVQAYFDQVFGNR